MCYYRCLVLLTWAALFTTRVEAGAWVQARSSGYAQFGTALVRYTSLHNNHGPPIRLARAVTDITLEGYLEYGLSSRFTISTYLPFKLVSTGTAVLPDADFSEPAEAGALHRPGNMQLGGRYQLMQKSNWVFSAQLRTEMPTGSYAPATGLRTGYDSWGIAPTLMAGTGWDKVYLSAETGPIFRTHNYSNHYLTRLEGGVHLVEHLQLILVLDHLKSLYDGHIEDDRARHTGLYTNNQEYLAYTLKLHAYLTDQVGMLLISSGGMPANQVPQGLVWMATVYFQWE